MTVGNTITIFDNNDRLLNFTFTDGTNPIDITGYTVWFTVKSNATDVDANAIIQVVQTVHSDPTNGITTIDLTNTLTAVSPRSYVYDIQIKDTSDDVTTVIKGSFVVNDRVTDAK